MIQNNKTIPLKKAPKLVFKSEIGFLSPYNLKECLNYLKQKRSEKKPFDFLRRTGIDEIVVQDSVIYFSAYCSGSQASVYFIGKIEIPSAKENGYVRGYIGINILAVLVGLFILLVIFSSFIIQFPPFGILIMALYLIPVFISGLLYMAYENYLRQELKNYIYDVLGTTSSK